MNCINDKHVQNIAKETWLGEYQSVSSVKISEDTIDMEFRPMPRTHEQAGRVRSMELEIRLASAHG